MQSNPTTGSTSILNINDAVASADGLYNKYVTPLSEKAGKCIDDLGEKFTLFGKAVDVFKYLLQKAKETDKNLEEKFAFSLGKLIEILKSNGTTILILFISYMIIALIAYICLQYFAKTKTENVKKIYLRNIMIITLLVFAGLLSIDFKGLFKSTVN